ncbi:hypothetical protein [Paenibacillus peoriae]|uniref:hypothetical protein n=1 Tax=Paenibacillus peoriae TaxID=59893 RepID=UPI001CC216D5|nr:hypothetical protein [Paenibacillus peoriae]
MKFVVAYGFQFGVDDLDSGITYDEPRLQWIELGVHGIVNILLNQQIGIQKFNFWNWNQSLNLIRTVGHIREISLCGLFNKDYFHVYIWAVNEN